MNMACSVDTPHKRAVLEAIEEEAVENELHIPLVCRSRLACARCHDAFRVFSRRGLFYPAYYRKWYSFPRLINMNVWSIIQRAQEAWGVLIGKKLILPGKFHTEDRRRSSAEDIERRQNFNSAVQSIADRIAK